MRLFLNEQEVVDGVCVWMASHCNDYPEEVDVKELSYHKNGNFSALADCGGHREKLGTDEIIEGVSMFLTEYHSFNPEFMNVDLVLVEGQGVTAEVTIGE